MTTSPERLEELQNMPYEEYVLTPEWELTRKKVLKTVRACQSCSAINGLDVYHECWDRLGYEEEGDLIVLCPDCFRTMEQKEIEPLHMSWLLRGGVGLSAATLTHITVAMATKGLFPLEVAGLIGSGILAYKFPRILGHIKALGPKEMGVWMERQIEHKPTDPKKWTLWDRALGRHELPAQKNNANQPTQEEDVEREEESTEEELFSFNNDDHDEETPTMQKTFSRFSELLASGFVPTINRIFIGRTIDGRDIFVPASKLCHVAIAGKTGGGKGSLMRLIMIQLCYVGVKVLLLNPHYMRWVCADAGAEFDEDWTPFEGINPRTGRPYLEAPPMDCAEMPTIEKYLNWAVYGLLEKRKAEGRAGGKRFSPYFIVIDEWPDIVDEIKKAPGYLSKLLRQGRKYGIFVMLASQDFQVKTIGMEGGSIRKCLLTCFYTGGDTTTAKELLYAEAPRDIPEKKLGQGVIMQRSVGTGNEAVLAWVPFVDNEAVYQLLGPSTFVEDHALGSTVEGTVARPTLEDEANEKQTDELDVTCNIPLEIAQNGAKMGNSEAYSVTRNDVTVASPTASRDDVSPINEVLPQGWTQEQVNLLPRLYRVSNNRENCLIELGISTSQDNRRFATDVLKQQGLWKEK